ncbi:reverse transcriptase domain, Reverse transcriptase zinc-binding domain protein [Artemisia annua]|uniref:Reverse transcriptase domain, Reverse transcriptase zinc-binding domain protein n=1 Tax=Artemisia annua TaxID=35608 RepID=A0A2U1MB56_ARTAN|nr:reverse transcriptase domain, Reverse transcriptase zinc-binding domain protein [Artemisia annua]
MSQRDMYDARFQNDNTVADLIVDNKWKWPKYWADMFPNILNLSVPNIRHGKLDVCKWRNNGGKDVKFSISNVWEDMREKREKVDWWKLIWFSQCLPRHAFILWIACVKKDISLGVVVYNIWKERNERIFTGEKKDADCLYKVTTDGIKLQLMSLQVKNSNAVRMITLEWDVKFRFRGT